MIQVSEALPVDFPDLRISLVVLQAAVWLKAAMGGAGKPIELGKGQGKGGGKPGGPAGPEPGAGRGKGKTGKNSGGETAAPRPPDAPSPLQRAASQRPEAQDAAAREAEEEERKQKLGKNKALRAVRKNGLHLKELVAPDKDVILAAVTQNGEALQYVPQHLKEDREIALCALQPPLLSGLANLSHIDTALI